MAHWLRNKFWNLGSRVDSSDQQGRCGSAHGGADPAESAFETQLLREVDFCESPLRVVVARSGLVVGGRVELKLGAAFF